MTPTTPSRPSSAWRPGAWDVLLAAVVVAGSSALLAQPEAVPGFRQPDAVTWVLTLGGAGAVVWARRQPLSALLVTGTAFVLLTWRGDESELAPFLVTGLLFVVGNQRALRPAVIGLVFAAAGLLASAASGPPDLGPRGTVQSLLIFTGAWVIGRLTRGRRQTLLTLVHAAEQQAETERELAAVERDRTSLAQAEERLRIARELHDVLAHSISVISVQATVGEHLAATDPPAAHQALRTIGEVSRSSMSELRQMLSLLRDDPAADAPGSMSYQPSYGLSDLESLIDTYRSAGLPVRTDSAGEPRALPAATDLCAYRIIQEALTNTLKHAGPGASAIVRLRAVGRRVEVEVADDGLGRQDGAAGAPPPVPSGHGLRGMAERVASYGGALEAGPRRPRGWGVRAVLDTGASDSGAAQPMAEAAR